jgi:hypothetical protein
VSTTIRHRGHGPAATTLVPRIATLDGFVTSASEGINLHAAPPMTSLSVRTRNTSYRIVVASGGLIYVQGGRYFPTLKPARLDGASAGGSLLKLGWIVIGLCMEVSDGTQRIITSPVREIVRDDPPPPGRAH